MLSFADVRNNLDLHHCLMDCHMQNCKKICPYYFIKCEMYVFIRGLLESIIIILCGHRRLVLHCKLGKYIATNDVKMLYQSLLKY